MIEEDWCRVKTVIAKLVRLSTKPFLALFVVVYFCISLFAYLCILCGCFLLDCLFVWNLCLDIEIVQKLLIFLESIYLKLEF